jgi:hypothetical protein
MRMALLTNRYVSCSAPSSPVTATTLTARLKNAEPGLHMTELMQQALSYYLLQRSAITDC